ncbi:protein O-linked-mannose beta-1,4-N-acetylglucosaminyltransferase 2-like isoform X1 [Penaeus monodon]|uniref:protein O-linked-mannose beta-1,4-N-acetylglucosaminyltransferase 2-like isoform X1 n=1 Tax=Penaeus monodon TaxID=6687 RepID=UPI0018A6DC73|nr:protein O-linked-mannose beta-1,4-N-acetylglucosaminyltransferase 2-like isoform X1 [Penaeus monodon]
MLAKGNYVLWRLLVMCTVMWLTTMMAGGDQVHTSASTHDMAVDGDTVQKKNINENVRKKCKETVVNEKRYVGITDTLKFQDDSSACSLDCGEQYTSNKENMKNAQETERGSSDLSSDLQNGCSSVWCYSSFESGLRCHFSNLYYNHLQEEFVFVSCDHSIIYGIKNLKALQETLYLSSVENHSAFKLSISVIPWPTFITSYRSEVVTGQSFIMARFKPDNLLHVFHDDLLPFYFTSYEICAGKKSCQSRLNVIFVDKNDHGKHWNFYKVLSERVSLISDLSHNEKDVWTQFEHIYFGLNKISVWYQYGYGKPQGPTTSTSFSGHLMRKFTDFVLEGMDIQPKTTEVLQGVLFSRKSNRKIINEKEVSTVLKTQLDRISDGQEVDVKILSLEEHGFHRIIEELTRTHVAVGVHGAGLILSMFLPPGAVLIEIFPLGISPSAATVFKTMCELKGVGITYIPWSNKDLLNSIYHSDNPAHYGGISHLPEDEQEKMIQALGGKEIINIECCDNPTWLFRIYQDTVVHIEGDKTDFQSIPFSEAIVNGLQKAERYLQNSKITNTQMEFYPSVVKDAKCSLERTHESTKLFAEWKPPWNILDVRCTIMFYEVVMQIKGDINAVYNEVFEENFLKRLRADVETVDLWITCFCNNIEGVVLYLRCL